MSLLLGIAAATGAAISFGTADFAGDPPIVTMFLARFVVGEALPRAAYLSVGLACAGIGLMVTG